MSDHNQDSQQDEHGLQNLPEGARKETEEILSEIDKEAAAKAEADKSAAEASMSEEEKKKAADEAAEKAKADEDAKKKAEDDKKKSDQEGDKEPRRDTKLIPAWKLKVAEDQAKKREDDLIKEIETLKTTAKPADDKSNEKKPEDQNTEIKTIVDKIVAENNIEDPKVIEDMFAAIDAYVKNKTALPQDILEKLKDIDTLKSKAQADEIAIEEANFNKDFDKIILPLVKAEYGDDVPQEKIDKIKGDLKGIAYTPEYEKISYDEIYLGKKDFRGLHAPKARSAEGDRSGSVELKKGEGSYDRELSEAEYNALSMDEQEKYENSMAKRERKQA